MRIAVATDFFSPWIGGPATFIDNFCAYISRTSHHVEIIAPSIDGRPARERRDGVLVHRVPTVALPIGHQLRVCLRPGAVQAALRAAHPDVLQIHHPFPLSRAALRAAREASIPTVAVNHTIPSCSLYGIRNLPVLYPLAMVAFGRYLTAFLAGADAVSTPTATAAALIREVGLRREISVISNGIDTARFVPATDRDRARAALGLPPKPTILYTGRLDPEKDLITLLRGAARAMADIDAHLVLGGDGTVRDELERTSRQLGIADRVSFPGFVPAAQLPLLYQAADVYCMASAVELQSISTLEALASGLPVVAARAAALPELIEDGMNGALVAPGDAAAFGAAIRDVLSDSARAARMGRAGRLVAEGHAIGLVARQHLTLLARTAGRQGDQSETA